MTLFLKTGGESWITPVVMPLGPKNARPFVYASYGIVFPFITFLAVVVQYFYSQWNKPAKAERESGV